MALQIQTSRYMDEQMEQAMKEAQAAGWSDDGKVIYVRRFMDAVYETARRMECGEELMDSALIDGLAEVRQGAGY